MILHFTQSVSGLTHTFCKHHKTCRERTCQLGWSLWKFSNTNDELIWNTQLNNSCTYPHNIAEWNNSIKLQQKHKGETINHGGSMIIGFEMLVSVSLKCLSVVIIKKLNVTSFPKGSNDPEVNMWLLILADPTCTFHLIDENMLQICCDKKKEVMVVLKMSFSLIRYCGV